VNCFVSYCTSDAALTVNVDYDVRCTPEGHAHYRSPSPVALGRLSTSIEMPDPTCKSFQKPANDLQTAVYPSHSSSGGNKMIVRLNDDSCRVQSSDSDQTFHRRETVDSRHRSYLTLRLTEALPQVSGLRPTPGSLCPPLRRRRQILQ